MRSKNKAETGAGNTAGEKVKQSKSTVVEPTEQIEVSNGVVDTPKKTSKRSKKSASADVKPNVASALETPIEKKKKSGKSKAATTEKSKTKKQTVKDLPMGQGKVQQVRIQVNGNLAATILENNSVKSNLATVDSSGGRVSGALIEQPKVNSVMVEAVQAVEAPFRVVKVRNVDGKVINLVAEVIPNKVIVQGIVHEQLFYVATDGIVHHLADNIPFSTFIDIPGAQPGMNTQITAIIEKVLTEVATDGLSITKRIVIEVFVKVTETAQVNLLSGNGPLVLLKEVVGENTKQLLVENDFTLESPALKVDEIVGRIQNVEVDVIQDKIIIQGILHKQIFYIGLDNLGRHQGEDVPFSLFIDLPGAEPGMDVQVHPRIETILFDLVSSTVVRQKAVMEFFVKVSENIRQQVTPGGGPLFKVEEFVGENTVQELSETVVTLPFSAVKVREIQARLVDITSHVINDKVIVQGTIHKQIFYISLDNIERHLAEDIPFSLFLDIVGADPGDSVKITPIIETVLFDLETAVQLRQKVVLAIHAVVFREVQMNLEVGVGPLFKVEHVIGEGTKQELITRREVVVPPQPPISQIIVSEVTIVFPEINAVSQQIIVRNEVTLPETAIKVKDIQAQIVDVTARVIEDGVLVTGFVEKNVAYVGLDNIVRNLTERVPFSVLVNVPGIDIAQVEEVIVEIENLSFELNAAGNVVTQVIVLRATVNIASPSQQEVTVVTDVQGPGVVQTKVRVRAFVLDLATGAIELREFDVVTDVTAPGILRTVKQTLLLDVVGDGNPNPVPVDVVVDVILR